MIRIRVSLYDPEEDLFLSYDMRAHSTTKLCWKQWEINGDRFSTVMVYLLRILPIDDFLRKYFKDVNFDKELAERVLVVPVTGELGETSLSPCFDEAYR